jgi:hypothetical protein
MCSALEVALNLGHSDIAALLVGGGANVYRQDSLGECVLVEGQWCCLVADADGRSDMPVCVALAVGVGVGAGDGDGDGDCCFFLERSRSRAAAAAAAAYACANAD